MRFALLAGVLLAGFPQDGPRYDVVSLDVERCDEVATADVDGDGRPDLLILDGRSLAIFRATATGIPQKPDARVRFDADAYLWSTATFPDVRGPQIVTFTARGIRRHVRGADGAWGPAEDLVIHPNLFEGSARGDVPPLQADFMPDLDGDGLSDALLFRTDELWIFRQSKGADGRPSFRIAQKLPFGVETESLVGWAAHQKLSRWNRVPVLVRGDWDGDGRPDLVWFRDETIGAFLQQADGSFAASEGRVIGGRKPKRRNTLLKFEAPPRIVDLDGDGMLDVATTYPTKGQVLVFLNRKGRIDLNAPDASLQGPGWSTGIYVEDLDGDGRREIVMGVVRKLDLFSGISAFLSKKVDLELHFFRSDARGLFRNEPAQILTFSIPFTFTATRDSTQIDLTFWPTFEADADGDGMKDLLLEADGGMMAIYRGEKANLMGARPWATIAATPPPGTLSTRVRAIDLNGDGRSDLVVVHRQVEAGRAKVEVRLSKK